MTASIVAGYVPTFKEIDEFPKPSWCDDPDVPDPTKQEVEAWEDLRNPQAVIAGPFDKARLGERIRSMAFDRAGDLWVILEGRGHAAPGTIFVKLVFSTRTVELQPKDVQQKWDRQLPPFCYSFAVDSDSSLLLAGYRFLFQTDFRTGTHRELTQLASKDKFARESGKGPLIAIVKHSNAQGCFVASPVQVRWVKTYQIYGGGDEFVAGCDDGAPDGCQDGVGNEVRFTGITGMCELRGSGKSTVLLIADSGNGRLRRLDVDTKTVTTLLPSVPGILCVACDSKGNIACSGLKGVVWGLKAGADVPRSVELKQGDVIGLAFDKEDQLFGATSNRQIIQITTLLIGKKEIAEFATTHLAPILSMSKPLLETIAEYALM